VLIFSVQVIFWELNMPSTIMLSRRAGLLATVFAVTVPFAAQAQVVTVAPGTTRTVVGSGTSASSTNAIGLDADDQLIVQPTAQVTSAGGVSGTTAVNTSNTGALAIITGGSTNAGIVVNNAGNMNNGQTTGGAVILIQELTAATQGRIDLSITNALTGTMSSARGPIILGSASATPAANYARSTASTWIIDNSGLIESRLNTFDGAIRTYLSNTSSTSAATVQIFNRAGGRILGARDAITSGTATIDNAGIIRGAIALANSDGIDIRGNDATGTIFNRTGGLIEGNARGIVGGGNNVYTGGGTTFATATAGSTAYQSTVRHLFITNEAGATIRGVVSNAIASSSGLTIDNAGTITSDSAGAITVSGTPTTGTAVLNANLIGNSTITIRGTGAVTAAVGSAAISLNGFGNPNDVVTIEAGANIVGNVDLGGGTNDNVNLGGAGTGTLNGQIQNTEALNVNSADWTLTSNVSAVTTTTIASGATLRQGNGGTGGAITAGNIVNNGALIYNRSNDFTQDAANAITGTGSFTIANTGEYTANAANTYSGDTNVNAGGLTAGAANTFSAASVHNVATGATIDLAGLNQTIAGLGGAGNVDLGSATLTVNGAANTLFSGGMVGTGGLTRAGTGTLTLSGANSYTGATDVQSGVLAAGAANSFSSVSDLIVAGGATADLGGFNQSIDSLSGSGAVTLGAGTLTIAGADSATFAGTIAGTGGLTQAGAGTTTLSGANSYSGATTISNGTIAAGAANALSAASVHDIASAGTLNLGNANQSVAGLTGSGNVQLGSGTLTLAGAGNNSFAGVISGSGGLNQSGTGTTTLSGTNTFTGATTVNAGTLVNNGGLAGSVDVTAGALTNGGTITGPVTVAAGTLTNSGTINGAVSGTAATSAISNTGTMASLSLSNAATATNSNMITGDATLASGSTLTNTGMVGGNVDVLSMATSTGSGSIAGNVMVGNGGTLAGGQSVTGTVTVADGGHIAPGNSGIGTLNVGNLVLSNASIIDLDFAGPNLAAGVGSDYLNVASNLTLDGVVNITNLGALGPGVYRVFTYGGTLTNNGLSFGTIPSGLAATDFAIQTAAAGEVNIISNGTPGLGAPPALQFWDGSDPTLFNNGAVNGGSGTWQNAGAPSWSLANGSGNNAWGNGFAVFQGTSGTVTIGGAVDATGLQFTTNGYAITGGTLNLTDPTSVIRIDDAANTATISSVIGGVGNLTLRGAGTLILSGANTNTGATAIEGGTLRVEGGSALSDTQVLAITSPGRLQLGAGETLGGLMGSGSVDLGSNVLTLANGSDAAYVGNISGAGSVNFAGTASQTLSGANSYTGGTTVSSGVLRAGSTSAFGAGPVAINGGAMLDLAGFATSINELTGAGNLTLGTATVSIGGTNSSSNFAGVISGVGGVTHVGTGTLTLSGANTYTGATTVSAGTLAAGSAGAIGSGAASVANGATLNLAGFNSSVASLSGAGTVDLGSATLTLNTGAAGANFAGVVTGAGGVTMAGSGTQTLSGANSYTGETAINSGSLRAGSTTAFGAGNVNVASGATLDLAGFATTLQTLNGAGAVTIGAGSLTVGANNASSAFAGVISGPGSLNQTGTGTFTVSGANTYTGATNVNGGTLRAGAANTLGAGAVNVAAGATLDLNGFNNSIGGLNGAGAVTLGTGALTLGTGNTSGSFAGVISGAGSVAMTGTGTQVLSGANSFTGGLNVTSGTVRAGSTSAFGAGPVTVDSGARLDLAGFNTAIGALNGAGSVTLGSAALTLGGTNSSSTFAGVISGTGAVNHVGTGTLTLAGANTYSGGTNVNGGTVALGSASALGTGPVAVASGATLNLAGQNVALGALSGSGNIALGSGNLTLTGSAPTTYAGAISGTGGVVSNNTSSVTLSGANTYTGPTTVNSGVFNNTGSLASAVTVNGGRFVNNGSTTASVTVNTGALYQGTGSVGTAIFGGIVAPGNSIGTTNVNGNATFLATSTYQVEVDQTGASDRLNATGNITINGGTVQVLAAPETATARYANANRYTILGAGGTVSGTFTTVTSNLAFLAPSLTYNSNSVVLNLLRNDVRFAAAAATDNQKAVANAIDAAGGTSPFYAGLLGLSASQVPGAFDQLSGEFYASAPTMLYRENSDIRRSILTHQSRSADVKGTAFWANYLNSDAEQSAVGTSNVDRKGRGYILGADHSFGAVRVGLSAAMVDSDITAANLGSTGDASSQYFSAYIGSNFDRFSANIALTHGTHSIDVNRAISAAGITDATAATLKGNSTQVYGELGYAIIDSRIKLEPFAGFALQISNFGAGSETGGNAALDIEKTSFERPIVSLGARSAVKITDGIRLSGSVAQQFTRGSAIDRELKLRSIGRSFDVAGAPIDGDSLVYDAGLEGRFGNLHVGVSYVGESASSYTSNAVRATLGIRF
jgi:fibronectin-binding autotransporter adhesin